MNSFCRTLYKSFQTQIGLHLNPSNVLWGGGFPLTINVRLQMVCTFIGTLCTYTTRIMRSLKRSSRCYLLAVGHDGRATVVQVSWRRCCLEDCWECCSSLRLARWGVRFSEARWSQRVDLPGSHLSLRRPAPVAGYIATYRTCRAYTRTALLELYVLTGWTILTA
jgi:hypothetical protein